MLILAAVGLSSVLSDKGVFSRAETAGEKYNEAKAREVLETVLLTDGQYEKNINPEYNQDEFLNDLIKNEIPDFTIKGDVAIIGKYAYELDRSVPKIGRYLGKAEDLVWPTVNATVELANDKKNATINIKALEEKNGINKIEIWLLGEKIEEYTYDNIKTEVTVNPPYIATQNGKYTIKAYGDLMSSTTVTVDGIVASVKFEPNGNNEWQKSHSTTVTIQETADKVVKAKYTWTNSVNTPEDNLFPEEQTFNSGDAITKDGDTGTYYLWIMLEVQSGKKIKLRSENFNFDNEGPTITNFTINKYSIDGLTLAVTAQDTKSGIIKFEFYIDGVRKGNYTQTILRTTSSVTKIVNITGLTTGNHTCMAKVYDAKDNNNSSSKSGFTKQYKWKKEESITTTSYNWYSRTGQTEYHVEDDTVLYVKSSIPTGSQNSLSVSWGVSAKKIGKANTLANKYVTSTDMNLYYYKLGSLKSYNEDTGWAIYNLIELKKWESRTSTSWRYAKLYLC